MDYKEPNIEIIILDNIAIYTLGGSDDETIIDWDTVPTDATQL